MKDVKKLKEYFQKDRYIIKNGIEIAEVNDEYALCRVKITDSHLNAKDMVQGGMIYTIADFTFAVLANYLHNFTVTQSATISYMRPALGCKELFAKSKELDFTKHNCMHEVRVYDEGDKTIALLQINGFIV